MSLATFCTFESEDFLAALMESKRGCLQFTSKVVVILSVSAVKRALTALSLAMLAIAR